MFASLTGTITSKNPPEIVLEVGDISYEIFCPMSSFYIFEKADKIKIYIHLSIKEDSHTLFGFTTIDEKNMFRELIKVSGVGPKVALAILSHFSVANLSECINNNDDILLARTPGIGKKTAQKLIIELQSKISQLYFNKIDNITNKNLSKAKQALHSLGFKDKEIEKMVKNIKDENISTEELIRLSLKNR